MQQHYTWMRAAFEGSWDPIWATATRPDRVKLLKKACLAAASGPAREEAGRFSDAAWAAALDTFEGELTIIMQSQAEPGGYWVDIAFFRGFAAISDAMRPGINDLMAPEALRLFDRGGPRMWMATKSRRGRWILHTKSGESERD
jgi:hypothetical protein